MKKLFASLLSAAMLLTLAACGSKAEENPAGKSDNAQTEAPSEVKELDWPKRTITVQVGFKAGGDTDYYARMTAQKLEELLGKSVIVVNTEGVNGQVAAREVLGADPDGYTCYFTHTVSLYQEACSTVEGFSYVEDFAPGGFICADKTFCFAMRTDSGIQTVDELIEKLKAEPECFSVSSSYAGLADYVIQQFERSTGTKMESVDVGSNATDRVTALLNGSVDILPINYSNVADYVTTGEVVALGVCADERCAYLPDVPTLKEQGVECVATKFYYFAWPKETDPAIIEKFNGALAQVAEDPAFAEAISTFNGEVSYTTPEDHTTFAKETIADMKTLIG